MATKTKPMMLAIRLFLIAFTTSSSCSGQTFLFIRTLFPHSLIPQIFSVLLSLVNSIIRIISRIKEMRKIATNSSQYSGNKLGNNRNKEELTNSIIVLIIKTLVIFNPN